MSPLLTRDGQEITCTHSGHYDPADGLPYCHDGSQGRRCEGYTVQCGKGHAPCERHADRREVPAAHEHMWGMPITTGAKMVCKVPGCYARRNRPAVTVRTGTGETTITCAGQNEAAQLALTLACDGWTARLDVDTLEWIDNEANFDQHNAGIIRRAH